MLNYLELPQADIEHLMSKVEDNMPLWLKLNLALRCEYISPYGKCNRPRLGMTRFCAEHPVDEDGPLTGSDEDGCQVKVTE